MKILRLVALVCFFPLLGWATVTSQTDKTGPFLITSVPQTIPVGFPFVSSSELLVLDTGPTSAPFDPAKVLTLGSDYTVTGGNYNSQNQMLSGSIAVVGTGAHSVAANDYLVIKRNLPINQTSSFTSTGPLTVTLIEQALDKMATLSQQVNEIGSRSLQFENFEFGDPTLYKYLRAGNLLGFNSLGAPTYYSPSIIQAGSVATGTYVLPNGTTTPRTLGALTGDLINAKDFGAKCDGVTDDTLALNTAFAYLASVGGGQVMISGPNCLVSGQLVIDGNYISVVGIGGRESTKLTMTYTAGPAIVVGNSSTQISDVTFQNLWLEGTVGQTLVWSKYVRGLHFINCRVRADKFVDLGDAATPAAVTYIFDLYDCEGFQLASSTMHFITASNFSGQLDFRNTFVEGQQIAGLDGFNAGGNVQTKIDHLIVNGGYFGRFRDNWSFVDARVVNAYWANHLSENALRNSFRFEVTSSTSKSTSAVGAEYLNFSNVNVNANGHAFYFKDDRATVEIAGVMINGCQFTTSAGLTSDGFLYAEGTAGYIDGLNLLGCAISSAPTNGTSNAFSLIGPNLRDVTVDNVEVKGLGTNWLNGVYIATGTNFYDINIGSVTGEFTTTYVDDTTGKALVSPNYIHTTTTNAINFGTVNANTAHADNFLWAGVKTTDQVTVTDLTGVTAGIVFVGRVDADDSITITANNVTTGNIVVNSPSLRVTVNGWR